MKALPFTIPHTKYESIRIQEDILDKFYEHFHAHEEIQLTWIIRGIGTLLIEQNILPFSSNSVFLIGANKAHMFRTIESKEQQVHSLSLYFNPERQLEGLFALPENIRLKDFITRVNNGYAILQDHKSVQSGLFAIQGTEGTGRVIEFLSLLHTLSKNPGIHLQSLDTKSSEIKQDQRIQNIMRFTIENYPNQINNTELASLINMTPESFSRLFKQKTGKTYVEYLNEVRITEACRKIVFQDIPVNEIAYACGFNHVQHFNRVFKKLNGVSPGRYKLKHARSTKSSNHFENG